MKAFNQITTASFCWVVLLCFALPVSAEIYKYKDANGKWQFTDKPPKSVQKVETVIYRGKKKSVATKNLAEKLTNKYNPATTIEKTTLAVVSIETSLGSGSGFFISGDGYIVTNKHVVRPTEFKEWKKTSGNLDKAKNEIEQFEKNLKKRRVKLDKMEKELRQYKKDIDQNNWSDKNIAYAEYHVYHDRYREMRAEHKKAKKILKEKKKKLSSASYDFNSKSTSAKFSRQFKIILKDGTKVRANLVRLSKKHDLALLKLDGHITPFIDIDKRGEPSQGMEVYAIGSPLGLKDFVTSGIITGQRSDSIYTDTQILPGNSGGPLVDQEGKILGVNTQKLMSTKSIGSEGFGISIPVKFVVSEFSSYLTKPPAKEKVAADKLSQNPVTQ